MTHLTLSAFDFLQALAPGLTFVAVLSVVFGLGSGWILRAKA